MVFAQSSDAAIRLIIARPFKSGSAWHFTCPQFPSSFRRHLFDVLLAFKCGSPLGSRFVVNAGARSAFSSNARFGAGRQSHLVLAVETTTTVALGWRCGVLFSPPLCGHARLSSHFLLSKRAIGIFHGLAIVPPPKILKNKWYGALKLCSG